MKLFDLHADIGYSVMDKRKAQKQDIITAYHLPKLQEGGFSWVCMASYFEGHESWEDMQEMVLALKEEIALCKDCILVQNQQDLEVPDKLHAILTIEGMCGIKEDPIPKIDWLYEQGIQIASFAWNDENALATGARGNPNRGLTDMGKLALRRMEEHNMIVDVSHANEKTFWDILENTKADVIATHSNARSLCDHVRNLKDEQLLALAKRGGLIGVVTAGFFVDKDREKQDVAHLVQHIQYLKDLIGVEHIAFGFDFMDDFANTENDMLTDLASPHGAQKVIKQMYHVGFTQKEVEMIAYENAFQLLKKHIQEKGSCFR